jgi:opacity protein-like surface antigen
MDWLRPFVVAGAVSLALVGTGHAADMPDTMPPPRVEPLYVPPSPFLSGWYLRGDIGERWGFLNAAESAPGFADPTDNSLGRNLMYGLGVGFRSGWIRGDLTVDYGGAASYRGTVATPGDVTAKIQTGTGLLNLYADLGTWFRMTPYIGAGIGTARVTTSDFNSLVVPPYSGAPTQTQWTVAWAAMAGTAIAVTPNLQVDIGYRYLDVGNVHTADGTAGAMTFKNVGGHEVRLGLRWNFTDLTGLQ